VEVDSRLLQPPRSPALSSARASRPRCGWSEWAIRVRSGRAAH